MKILISNGVSNRRKRRREKRRKAMAKNGNGNEASGGAEAAAKNGKSSAWRKANIGLRLAAINKHAAHAA
jgi:hypothetical protein